MSRNKFNLKDKKTKIIIGSTIIIVLLLFIGIGLGLYSINNTDSKNIATQGQDKTDKKEESKKEESKTESDKSDKKEENSADTETSSKEESKSESSNTGSSSNGGSSSSNNEVANKPSNGGGSSSSGSGSSNGGGNTSTPNPPAHSHSWNPVTDTVWHDEVGHYETVVIKDAWTEEVPIYEEREVLICNDCGADITSLSEIDFQDHVFGHLENGGKGSWSTDWRQVQVGTDKINHPAVTEDRWVIDKAAWSETVTTGYKCSCGATK